MSNEAQDAAPSEETVSAQPSATTLALKKVTDNLAEFDAVEAGLQDLEKKYKNVVFDVSTPKGMDEAKKARAAIREPRYAIQNAVTEAKRPLEAMKKALAARGEQIIARIEPLETPIDTQIKNREKEIEDAKEAERQREAEAAAKVTAAIQAMHEAMADAIGQPVEVIDSKLEQVGAVVVDLDTFGDRTGEAEQTKTRALEALKNLREQRVAFDAQQAETARLAAEQAEREEKAAKERKEREEQDERDRQARKAQQDKEDAERRERLDREERELNERRAKLDAEEKAARDARQAKEDAERKEREDREQAERDRKDREAEELRVKRANWRQLIDTIKTLPPLCNTVSSIDEAIERIGNVAMAEDNFGEYLEEAVEVADKAMQELEAKRTAAVEREERAQREQAEREERAKLDAAAEKARNAGPALLAAAIKAMDECVDLIETDAGHALEAAIKLATE